MPIPGSLDIPTILTDKKRFLDDIERLLEEATHPIVNRRRTVLEWFRSVDPKAKQLADKLQVAQTAAELLTSRKQLYDHFCQMVTAATDAQVAVLEARIKVREQYLRILTLNEQIWERGQLADTRLKTRALEAHRDFETLVLEAHRDRERLRNEIDPSPQPPRPDPMQQAIDQHRIERKAKAQALQAVLSDFLDEVELVMKSRVGHESKAQRLQLLLRAYEMTEEDLPFDARWALKSGETLKDE